MKKSPFLRVLALASFMALPMALPAFAQPIPIDEISDFLNQLKTAKGFFTQINSDGSISTGKIYISRPGKMRFEYDLPDQTLVMAGGGAVAIFDRKSNQPPQQFPLKRTPLSVILQRNVDLNRANMITGITSDETSTTITAQDPDNPDIGSIQLVFSNNPVELRQWLITDEGGNQTTVVLRDMEQGMRLKSSLFSIQLEVQAQAPER